MEKENLLLGNNNLDNILISLKRFPLHVEKTNNKVADNKFVKVNNQSIYNGAISRFTRAIVVKNLQSYVVSNLPNLKITQFPISINLVVRTVENHGSISRRNGRVIWKPAKEDYEPTWDMDNLTSIWMKIIIDSLTLKGIIPDDNVKYVRAANLKIEFVDDIEDREINIEITRL